MKKISEDAKTNIVAILKSGQTYMEVCRRLGASRGVVLKIKNSLEDIPYLNLQEDRVS